MISTIGELFNLNHFDQSSSANDVIVIRHKDGSLHASPFNVRFGRAKIWNSINKIVQVEVNGVLTSAVMKIGRGGVAYWLQPNYGPFMNREVNINEANTDAHHVWNPHTSVKEEFSVAIDNAETSSIDAAAWDSLQGVKVGGTVNAKEIAAAMAEVKQADQQVHMLIHSVSQKMSKGMFEDSMGIPLFHKKEDGTICVCRNVIHSSEDAQQVKLALQAVTAAEISRKRLSNLLIPRDSLAPKTTQQEDQKLASLCGTAINLHDTDANTQDLKDLPTKNIHDDNAFISPLQTPEFLNLSNISLPLKAAASNANAKPLEKQPPYTRVSGESSSGVAAGGNSLDAQLMPGEAISAEEGGLLQAGQRVATPHDLASNFSHDSIGSDSSAYQQQQTNDGYLLDPIEPLEVAEEQLWGGCSFSSGLTSGVSVTDLPQPAETAAAREGTEEEVSPPTTTAVVHPSTNAGRENLEIGAPLHSGKEADNARVSMKEQNDNGKAPNMRDSSPQNTISGKSGSITRAKSYENNDAHAGTGPYFLRSLVPVKEDIEKLNLREGCNSVRYLAQRSRNRGVVYVSCNIFLWDCTDKLVVSDVDGTITKSDLWGHLYQAFGKGNDWTHPGTCSLFAKIAANGYKMVYLSARSVTQIEQTKRYLWSLEQDGVRIPLGPVLTAPLRLFTALSQELSRQSHVFKIACLESVRAAFPAHTRPFFAGFGNRYSDVVSYDAAGIPVHRIFIIDPSSKLRVCQVQQTYRNLAHLVDITFPRVHRRQQMVHKAYVKPSNALVSGNSAQCMASEGVSNHPMSNTAALSSLNGATSAFFSSKDIDVLSFNFTGQEEDPQSSHNAKSTPCTGSERVSREDIYESSGVDFTTRGLSPQKEPCSGVANIDSTHTSATIYPDSHQNTKRGNPLGTANRHVSVSPSKRTKSASISSGMHKSVDSSEYVAVDPDFSSYNHWRLNPSDLVSPPPTAKALGKGDGDAKEFKNTPSSVGATTLKTVTTTPTTMRQQLGSANAGVVVSSGVAGRTPLTDAIPSTLSVPLATNSRNVERGPAFPQSLLTFGSAPQTKMGQALSTATTDPADPYANKASPLGIEHSLSFELPSAASGISKSLGKLTRTFNEKDFNTSMNELSIASAAGPQTNSNVNTVKKRHFFSFAFSRKNAPISVEDTNHLTSEAKAQDVPCSQTTATKQHQHPDALTYYTQLKKNIEH